MGSTPSHDTEGRLRDAGDFFSRLGRHIDNFWRRVTEGLETQILWAQFMAEARASYSLYAREVDWGALGGETRFRRLRRVAGALFWAMLLKLSPARRVFLLMALVLAFLAAIQAPSGGREAHPSTGVFNLFYWLSLAALVFLLALELADRVTMKRDLEIAREIQRWLVPEAPPRVPGADVAFVSRPANTIGGDYYDAFLRDAGNASEPASRLLLVVADVAGKSVPAALLMATFQASLRSLAAAPTTLTELVARINRYACAHSLGGRRFTTAFFAELDPSNRALTYVRAGHDVPVLRRASGRLERLDAGDLPLGIDPGVHYEGHAITLASGDLLLIFTDGLVEAVNEKQEEFGESRLLGVLETTPEPSAEGTLKRLVARVDAFTGAARQHDDITCLILRVA